MHPWLKRIAGYVLLSLLLPAMVTGISEKAFKALPLNEKAGPALNPENFLSDWSYADGSITVEIHKGKEQGTAYLYAHVKITDPSQLRTASASGFSSTNTLMARNIAKRTNAVVAINGDCYPLRKSGYIVRQGKRYRSMPSGQDILIIDSHGDMTGLYGATAEVIDGFYSSLPEGCEVWNIFSFGPILVENGKSVVAKDIIYFNIGAQNPAQRACIAQIGPLEYLIVSSEGPEDPDGNGFTIPQFAEVVENLGYQFSENGVRIAYNLDGGTSNSLIFNNRQINSPDNPKKNAVTDIIYFSSLPPAE